MELQEKLNLVTNNKYGFQSKSAVLDSTAGICLLEFYYNDGTILTKEDKDLCATAIKEYLPQGFGYNVKYIKNFVTDSSIREYVVNFFNEHFASVSFIIDNILLQSPISIFLSVASEQQTYVEAKNLRKQLANSLGMRYDSEFFVSIAYKDNMINFLTEDNVFLEENSLKNIVVEITDNIVGEVSTNKATYIRDSKIVGNTITVCGHIKELQQRFTKPKIKEGQKAEQIYEYFKNPNVPLSERKEAGQREYYRFKIEDFTGDILCSYFPKADEGAKFAQLSENAAVIVQGEVRDDSFSGISLKPTSIAQCTLPSKWEEEIDYKDEKDFYEYVQPKEIQYTNQVGLFSMFEKPKVAPFLMEHKIVVFDFETTGFNPYNGDRIVEIGAVKVINGIITQSFRTLVNPEMHIPEESTKVHKIVDEDVIDAPKASEALQDFYKFTRGCLLVGYNVSFDYSFLIKQGKESRYNFEAETFDILELARQQIKGLKHYKLKDVSKYLGVTLDNAHSALYDTIATAEVMIKLLNAKA